MKSDPLKQSVGIIEGYRARLPVSEETPVITLAEGNTPLLPLRRLHYRCDETLTVFVKYEGMNPSGSYKDRGMTLAISKAMEAGAKAVICASTGNTSASAAAYAAAAGIPCIVVIPEGKIAIGKLAQALLHGACVVQIHGNFDEGLSLVKSLSQKMSLTIVNSLNPYRLQGQKTAAFEIIDTLGNAPDFHILPVGNAGNIVAHWMGYKEYHNEMHCQLPRLLGIQAEQAAPFVRQQFVEHPETVATAIRIGKPQSWEKAWAAQKESGGEFSCVTDAEILAAQHLLAKEEGIFVEPAAAVPIAGLFQACAQKKIPPKSTVVCTLTGHGLKDPDVVLRATTEHIKRCTTDEAEISKIINEALNGIN